MLTALIVFIIDFITKRLAKKFLSPVGKFEVCKGFFSLTYIENKGAMYGILKKKKVLLFIINIVLLLLIIAYWYFNIFSPLQNFAMGLLFGGATGNFADRIINKKVIDFLQFEKFNFPIFNIADVAIISGMILFIIESFI